MEDASEITVFDVAPSENEIWYVLVDGTILGACHNRNNAVAVASALARVHPPARLVTRNSSGDIEAITPFFKDFDSRGLNAEPFNLPANDTFELH